MDNKLYRDKRGLVDDVALPELANGRKVVARISGSGGPPFVVTLAGLGSSTMQYGFTNFSFLREKVTFIELDRLGIGLSGSRPDPLRPVDAVDLADECGEALSRICEAKGFSFDDLAVVTHSFAGNIAPTLIERAPNHGLRFTHWLDCDGSTPEFIVDPLEAAAMFDGPVFPICRCCARGGSALHVTPAGRLLFHDGQRSYGLKDVANVSPINLVGISRQVRAAVITPELRYCRLTRHRRFHPENPKVHTTPENEQDWLAQGVAKALALRGSLVETLNVGHAFASPYGENTLYAPNPHLVAVVLTKMLRSADHGLGRESDLADIRYAGGRTISDQELWEYHAEKGLPEVEYGTFAGVPRSGLLSNVDFAQAFQDTQSRRSPLPLLRRTAEAVQATAVLDELDAFLAANPKLARDPALRYLPPEPAVQGFLNRLGAQSDKALASPPRWKAVTGGEVSGRVAPFGRKRR